MKTIFALLASFSFLVGPCFAEGTSAKQDACSTLETCQKQVADLSKKSAELQARLNAAEYQRNSVTNQLYALQEQVAAQSETPAK